MSKIIETANAEITKNANTRTKVKSNTDGEGGPQNASRDSLHTKRIRQFLDCVKCVRIPSSSSKEIKLLVLLQQAIRKCNPPCCGMNLCRKANIFIA